MPPGGREKVTEKIEDLRGPVPRIRPRFNVVVLDTEAFGYRQQLNDLTKDSAELRDAIKSAPENSILFHANKRVQRLAFNEFLQLDKTASEAANGGRATSSSCRREPRTSPAASSPCRNADPRWRCASMHELLSTEFAEGRGRAKYDGRTAEVSNGERLRRDRRGSEEELGIGRVA